MAVNVTSPLTGAAQQGLVTPAFVLATDQYAGTGKQQAVVSGTGTLPNARFHTGSDPFLLTAIRPSNFRSAPTISNTGLIVGTVPINAFYFRTRKGVFVSGTIVRPFVIETRMLVPAGADVADPFNIRIGLSAHIGGLWQQSSGWGDTDVTNVL